MLNHRDRALIGWSEAMETLRENIRVSAPTSLTVMILGERGTGKELVAREIHRQSNRAKGPFIQLNCASLPETLVESELFGSEKGAFTGAEFRKGRFEQAHGGTLLLDEIGELSITAQPKLLRVLEGLEVDRVGGHRPIPVDVRLIVSTNRNLEEMVECNRFRADLYDRLNMDSIRTPPLRERLDDIPILADYLIGAFVPEARRMVNGVALPVMELFQKYSWPGNVRQLQNVIRQAVFKGRSDTIRLEDLPYDFVQKTTAPPLKLSGNYHQLIEAYSRRLVVEALQQQRGNRQRAATLLGVSRAQIYKLVKMHGLDGDPETAAAADSSLEWLQ